MAVSRQNVDFAKSIGNQRVGNKYVYGGTWSRVWTSVGTDCSGICAHLLDAVTNGPAMNWTRHGLATESWRPVEVGQRGPFGTICVANPSQFPADAAVKLAIHHGPGGGVNSHMWCEVGGQRFESNGSDGCVTGTRARDVNDTSYANDWHYLPGPSASAPAPAPGPVSTQVPRYTEIPMWSPNNSHRNGRKIDLFLLHTQEGNGTARSLAQFLGNSANAVSYHYTVEQDASGAVTVVDVVDTDFASWSVLSANPRSINLCFAGSRAGWSRAEWMRISRAIEVAAYLAVQDCKKYGIPIRVLSPPYTSSPPGISDHKYVTEWLKDGNHTDVGNQFPWDFFTAAVTRFASATSTTPTTAGDDMASVPQDQWDKVYQELTKKLPSRSPLRHLGEGAVDTWAGMTLNTDGNLHILVVKMMAEIGDFRALELLAEIAQADLRTHPDRTRDSLLAKSILTEIEATRPQIIQKYLAQKGK
jgi:hypothetical protein